MKNKYIFGGVIVTVFLVLMVYLFTQSNIKYENDFSNVMQKEKTVKATGSWVKSKSYEYNKISYEFFFNIPWMSSIIWC